MDPPLERISLCHRVFLLENVLLCPVVRAVVFLISGVLEVVGFSKSFHKRCSEITFYIKHVYNLYAPLAHTFDI